MNQVIRNTKVYGEIGNVQVTFILDAEVDFDRSRLCINDIELLDAAYEENGEFFNVQLSEAEVSDLAQTMFLEGKLDEDIINQEEE